MKTWSQSDSRLPTGEKEWKRTKGETNKKWAADRDKAFFLFQWKLSAFCRKNNSRRHVQSPASTTTKTHLKATQAAKHCMLSSTFPCIFYLMNLEQGRSLPEKQVQTIFQSSFLFFCCCFWGFFWQLFAQFYLLFASNLNYQPETQCQTQDRSKDLTLNPEIPRTFTDQSASTIQCVGRKMRKPSLRTSQRWNVTS